MNPDDDEFLPLKQKVFQSAHVRRDTRDSIMYNGPLITQFLETNRKVQETSRKWSAIIGATTCMLFVVFVFYLSLNIANTIYIPTRLETYAQYFSILELVLDSIIGFACCFVLFVTTCIGFASACTGAFPNIRFVLAICYTVSLILFGLFGLVNIVTSFFANRNLLKISSLFQTDSTAAIILYILGAIVIGVVFCCCCICYTTCSSFQIRAVKAEKDSASTIAASEVGIPFSAPGDFPTQLYG